MQLLLSEDSGFVGGLDVLCRISALPDTLMAFSVLCFSVLKNEFCSVDF